MLEQIVVDAQKTVEVSKHFLLYKYHCANIKSHRHTDMCNTNNYSMIKVLMNRDLFLKQPGLISSELLFCDRRI